MVVSGVHWLITDNAPFFVELVADAVLCWRMILNYVSGWKWNLTEIFGFIFVTLFRNVSLWLVRLY